MKFHGACHARATECLALHETRPVAYSVVLKEASMGNSNTVFNWQPHSPADSRSLKLSIGMGSCSMSPIQKLCCQSFALEPEAIGNHKLKASKAQFTTHLAIKAGSPTFWWSTTMGLASQIKKSCKGGFGAIQPAKPQSRRLRQRMFSPVPAEIKGVTGFPGI